MSVVFLQDDAVELITGGKRPHDQPHRDGSRRGRGGRKARNSTDNGFILTLRFTGQQVAGMRGMFSQQCWLDTFQLPLSIVEPFVSDSTFVHTRKLWEEEEGKVHPMSLRLSNFYRMPRHGTVGLSLSTWSTFLATAPRSLIVVNVDNVYARSCLNFGPQSCLGDLPRSQPALKCKRLKMIKDSVSYLEEHGFKVVRTVCFNCSAPEMSSFTPEYITEYIFSDHKPQDVTVLMSHWKFSFQITPTCASRACEELTEAFKKVQPPSNLERAASRYVDIIDKLQGNWGQTIGTTIAVMVRLEWFIITYRNKSLEEVDTCLQSVMEAKHELEASATGSATRVLLALDVGKFGSGSFNKTINLHITYEYFEKVLARVKNIVLDLYNGKLNFDLWEESYVTATTEGSTDRSYIAALQSLTASKADCLVLMGGGHFQALALEKYSERVHSEKCIRKVCAW